MIRRAILVSAGHLTVSSLFNRHQPGQIVRGWTAGIFETVTPSPNEESGYVDG